MPLEPITDRQSHDAAISLSAAPDSKTLTIIYVTSSVNPICVRTAPKVEDLAEKYSKSPSTGSDTKIRFYSMELNKDTTPMIKLGVQNTPLFILMMGKYCTTILGPDMRRLEQEIQDHC